MKLLVLDNYDSFTYNLVHLLASLGCADLTVTRNDKISLEEINKFDRIVLSPGPGIPSEAGIMPELVRTYADKKSILGVCLGHQCIGEIFGGTLRNLNEVVHGKATKTTLFGNDPIFRDIPDGFLAGRYHSWVIAREDFPKDLEITAVDEDSQEVMAFRHKSLPIHAVQFHPESVLTPEGPKIISNWLSL